MNVLDPGHRYRVHNIDGIGTQDLLFVKREGRGYPGNVGHHPGTTLQDVLRVCRHRVLYLQGQVPCLFNTILAWGFEASLWFLETRAAWRHGKWYWHTPRFAATAEQCGSCGHTVCFEEHHGKVV